MGASRRVRSGVSGATWARSSPKANCFAARQSLKPLPLALGQVMSNPIRGNIAARKEAYVRTLRRLGPETPVRDARP